MTPAEYTQAILKAQTLERDGDEMKALQTHRADVEKLLATAFSKSSSTIRYGGSKAKNTMIRESYDLDIICYFPSDETEAGSTLKEIFENVLQALAKSYDVYPKTSAIRLRSRDARELGTDFHIDVVPGRFTDEKMEDAFLYISSGEKQRLKTNLDVHISHVRDSGRTDVIRLLKLWNKRRGLNVRTFVLELLVLEVLPKVIKQTAPLDEQLTEFWKYLRDHSKELAIQDPSNPTGNDLSGCFDENVRVRLAEAAATTLSNISMLGWPAVFGAAEVPSTSARVQALRATAATISSPAKPWCL
jgi:hypothetical protein